MLGEKMQKFIFCNILDLNNENVLAHMNISVSEESVFMGHSTRRALHFLSIFTECSQHELIMFLLCYWHVVNMLIAYAQHVLWMCSAYSQHVFSVYPTFLKPIDCFSVSKIGRGSLEYLSTGEMNFSKYTLWRLLAV